MKTIFQAQEARDKLTALLQKNHLALRAKVKIILHEKQLALQIVFPKDVDLNGKNVSKEYEGFTVLTKIE